MGWTEPSPNSMTNSHPAPLCSAPTPMDLPLHFPSIPSPGWNSTRAAKQLLLSSFTPPPVQFILGIEASVQRPSKTHPWIPPTPAHLPQLKSSSVNHPRLCHLPMGWTRHYDHGITRCRQYLLTEKGCPFLLEIKKKLLMLQTASSRPLIMSVKILIISH